MQRWGRSAGPERQDDRSPSQYLKLARGAKECHHIRWLCDGNQTKFVSLRAAAMVATLGGEEERGGLKSKDAVIRFKHYLCQRYISRLFCSAARRDFDESARGRSLFSNVSSCVDVRRH